MPYVALATDYDGTVAHDGVVDDATIAALERLRASRRRLILVTGRQVDDLCGVMPRLDLFDTVVAENGAVLYDPASKEITPLAEPPPPAFAERLRELGVAPLDTGHVIVATWTPNETQVLRAIQELGLELQITFNKGAVMVLPGGVTKQSGLLAALDRMDIAPVDCVGVGDAENDLAMLQACGLPVAVANALPSVRDAAAWVTPGARGDGVSQLIDRLVADDLADTDGTLARQRIELAGAGPDAPSLLVNPRRDSILLSGQSGGGKSTLTLGVLERLYAAEFQACVIDPEGDYQSIADSLSIGTAEQGPEVESVVDMVGKTRLPVIVNLLGVKLADRPAYFAELLPRLRALRAQIGRPHMLVVDEAHHMLPRAGAPVAAMPDGPMEGVMLVTVRPSALAMQAITWTRRAVVVGEDPLGALRSFCEAHHLATPDSAETLPTGQLWTLSIDDPAPRHLTAIPGRGTKVRHLRKYATGTLGDDKCFIFRGPHAALKLRAHNLMQFVDLADGVDDDTFEFHRRRGDYSRWMDLAIKDQDLTRRVRAIEHDHDDPSAARAAMREVIEDRYTLPA